MGNLTMRVWYVSHEDHRFFCLTTQFLLSIVIKYFLANMERLIKQEVVAEWLESPTPMCRKAKFILEAVHHFLSRLLPPSCV